MRAASTSGSTSASTQQAAGKLLAGPRPLRGLRDEDDDEAMQSQQEAFSYSLSNLASLASTGDTPLKFEQDVRGEGGLYVDSAAHFREGDDDDQGFEQWGQGAR
jgi:hypothetical protein